MNEVEARQLANEINQHLGWTAYAEEQPFLDRDNHDWWVKAHHDSMRSYVSTSPYPRAIITSRAEWDDARAKWGKP